MTLFEMPGIPSSIYHDLTLLPATPVGEV